MSELKRCPFCGGEAEIDCDNGFNNWFVKCKECGCKTPTKIAEHIVIEAWNERKPMERILERLEEKAKEYTNDDLSYRIPWFGIEEAIEIVKEEGGIE